MPRPQTITDQQILDAARAGFLEHGYGCATADIARRASVSEGSIFKRFPTKEALFAAAMGIPQAPAWMETLADQAGQGAVRDTLADIARRLLDTSREALPRLVALRASGFDFARGSLDDRSESPPERFLRALTDYFRRESDLGRIGPCNPAVAAHVLFGVIGHYVLMEMLPSHGRPPADADTFIRGLADLLWQGLAPQQRPSA